MEMLVEKTGFNENICVFIMLNKINNNNKVKNFLGPPRNKASLE
jgi:hypothetical protein